MNRTFTLCFSLYPIALPFGYVLIYTFYHYAVPDANSNFKVTNYAENLKFSSTIKSYNNTNKRSAHVITLLNGIQIAIVNLSVIVSASNGYDGVRFINLPNEMKSSKNIVINGMVNRNWAVAYYQASSNSFIVIYKNPIPEGSEVILTGTYLISE